MLRKLQLLSQAIRAFSQATPDHDNLLETITQKLSAVLDCFCAISFVSEDGERLEMVEASAKDPLVAEKLLWINRACPYSPRGEAPLAKILEAAGPLLVARTPAQMWRERFGDELYKEIEPIGGHSLLSVPVHFYDGRMGVFSLLRYGSGTPPFNEQDLLLLQSFAEHAVLALTNAKIFEEKQSEIVEKERLARKLQLLYDLSTTFAEVGDNLQELLDTLSSRVSVLFGGDCLVRLLTEADDGSLLDDIHSLHPEASMLGKYRALFAPRKQVTPSSLAWRIFTSKEPLFLREIPTDGLPEESLQLLRGLCVRSLMAVPLIARGRVIGIISSFRSHDAPPYTQEDFSFFVEVASRSSLFLLDADLYRAQQRELEEKKRLSDRLQFLSESAREFAEVAGEREKLLDCVVRRFQSSIGGGCIIRLFRGNTAPEVTARSYHPDPRIHEVLGRVTQFFSSPERDDVIERAIQSNEPLFVPVVRGSPLSLLARGQRLEAAPMLDALGVRSVLLVPLISRGIPIGVAVMTRHDEEPAHTEDDLKFFLDLTAHASLSLINSELVRSLQQELKDREAAEAALKRTEDQLRHSQKMEAIGRLAGGVAHDFNNILSVIMGYTGLLLLDTAQMPELQEPVQEISKAADRAAELTRQLLSFSRQQIAIPQRLSPNTVIWSTEKMLRRLIGESVELRLSLHPEVYPIKADPGQLEQVLMNLVVNARDAIKDGGSITIETQNAEFDAEYAREHLGSQPGLYAMIAVSDTGCGMDKATQDKIFEPFFTTKDKGKGTGLGLSTVFGIVQQHHGYIWVYSEPNIGTTFKLYFPRTSDAEQSPVSLPRSAVDVSGSETILLVEDDEQIRNMVSSILQKRGYQLLVASNGEEAWRLFEANAPRVDILFSDIVMPRLSGPELARRAQKISPRLKVLFMSGYTEGAFGYAPEEHHQNLLVKPLTPESILRRIREVLNQ